MTLSIANMPLGDIAIHDTYFFVSETGRWFIVGWLFLLGAVLGSFLNVVAYRLPRGMSLVHPGSRCPACGHAIRWHDNVPIVGWIMLGGRCRDCRAPISIRYPTVEALCGATCALVAWAELFVEAPPPIAGVSPEFALELGPYAFHVLLLLTLIATALMEFDDKLPPPRWLATIVAVGFVLASIWPQLRPPPADAAGPLAGVLAGGWGLLSALVLAALAWPAWVASARRADLAAGAMDAAALALAGVFLGARSLTVVAAGAMFLYLVVRWGRRGEEQSGGFGWAAALTVATLLEIVFDLSGRLAGDAAAGQGDARQFVLAGVLVAVLAVWARLVGAARPRSLEA